MCLCLSIILYRSANDSTVCSAGASSTAVSSLYQNNSWKRKKKNRSESASEKERERRKFGKQDKKRRKSKIDVFKARKILREYLYNLTGNDGMTSKTNSLLQS